MEEGADEEGILKGIGDKNDKSSLHSRYALKFLNVSVMDVSIKFPYQNPEGSRTISRVSWTCDGCGAADPKSRKLSYAPTEKQASKRTPITMHSLGSARQH